MDTCSKTFSSTHLLNEQIARQLFDVLPECGPIVVIVDRDGSVWPSRSEEFARLNLTETLRKDLQAKVDDGAEPVITQVGDATVIAAQLATDRTNCGYVLVALPRHTPDSALAQIDLVETVLSQVTLIARLVERSRMLTRSHVNHYAAYSTSGAAAN
ncbi:MAG: hypothetical protein FJ280_05755 [Planctomycetes bacterium]|nr:hypothetical protein [Planctomycetota bacterium]